MTVSNVRIVLHFDVHEPIELTELTLSFGSLARQYKKFLSEKARLNGQKVNDADVKLYITKIENNCILAELAGATQILGSLIPIMDYTNLFIDFTKNINDAIIYFQGVVGKKNLDALQVPYSKRECEDFANFLDVVSKNKGGKLGIAVADYAKDDGSSKTLAKFTFTSDEAFEAQKGALITLRALEYKGEADYKNVVMYYHQTNIEHSKSDGKTGEKAIIKSVHPKELPVYIISDLDREQIMSFKNDKKKNPFKASYRVDVNVETDRNDVPLFYRVLKLHEIIPGDDKPKKKITKKREKK